MGYPSLNSVECAILHNEFAPIDAALVFDAAQRLTARFNFDSEIQLMVTSTEKDVHIHVDGHRIMISQNPEPLDPEGFRNALTTPYTGMILSNAREIVQRHKANTFITIAKGMFEIPSKLTEGLGDAVSGLSSFTSWDEAERAMRLCRELTRFIIEHHEASAIHWCTSDNLVSQKFFEKAAIEDDFTMLGARPYFASSAGRMGEGLPLGAIFNGSQWLIGKILNFKEASVSIPWIMEVAYGFIKLCQTRGSIIPHNETFSVEGQDWVVVVFHEKIDGHDDWEMVTLEVIHAPQFEIFGDTTARRSFQYENEEDIKARAEAEKREVKAANDVEFGEVGLLDPSDEFDQAILKKLKNKKSADEIEQSLGRVQTTRPMQTFTPEPQEAWETPKNRADVEALRELARQNLSGNSKDADADDDENQSLIGKMSGLFSRG